MVTEINTTTDAGARALPTIGDLFAEWLAVRKKSDAEARDGNDEAANALYARYVELQKAIVDDRSPVTAKDMAIQIVVETDHMGSDWREEFSDRLLAFAKRPSAHPSTDEREAKFEVAVAAFREAAKEYDPTVLSVWISRREGDQPGNFMVVDGVIFNRSRAIEDASARARGEIA